MICREGVEETCLSYPRCRGCNAYLLTKNNKKDADMKANEKSMKISDKFIEDYEIVYKDNEYKCEECCFDGEDPNICRTLDLVFGDCITNHLYYRKRKKYGWVQATKDNLKVGDKLKPTFCEDNDDRVVIHVGNQSIFYLIEGKREVSCPIDGFKVWKEL